RRGRDEGRRTRSRAPSVRRAPAGEPTARRQLRLDGAEVVVRIGHQTPRAPCDAAFTSRGRGRRGVLSSHGVTTHFLRLLHRPAVIRSRNPESVAHLAARGEIPRPPRRRWTVRYANPSGPACTARSAPF